MTTTTRSMRVQMTTKTPTMRVLRRSSALSLQPSVRSQSMRRTAWTSSRSSVHLHRDPFLVSCSLSSSAPFQDFCSFLRRPRITLCVFAFTTERKLQQQQQQPRSFTHENSRTRAYTHLPPLHAHTHRERVFSSNFPLHFTSRRHDYEVPNGRLQTSGGEISDTS